MKTSKLRCLIVDDEPPARRILERYLASFPDLELVDSCGDAFSAMAVIQEEEVDLLLLDINMPELSGISLVKALPHPPLVIFTTAYPEYAVEGFDLEAVDYLVKPISLERFARAIQRVHTRLPDKTDNNGFLSVRADKRLYRIPWEDIRYLQAYGDYVRIFTTTDNLMTKARLTNLEEQLPAEQFIRIHRSYIVALSAIAFIEGNLVQIGDVRLPVGASHREVLLSRWGG